MTRVFRAIMRSTLSRYAVALILTGGLLLATALIEPFVIRNSTFMLMLSAVSLSAIIGGFGPGIVAAALSVAAALYWYVGPPHTFIVPDPKDQLRLILFSIISVLISILGGAFRAALKRTHEAEEQLRRLVQQNRHFAILSLDEQGRIVGWNEGAEQITGYTAAEMRGQDLSRLNPPEETDPLRAQRSIRSVAEIGPQSIQGWRVRKDGGRFWASVTLTPLRDESGQIRGFSALMRDQTEQKRAEDALRASHDLSRAILNAMPMEVSVLDHAGNIIAINNAWRKFAVTHGDPSPLQVSVGANYLDVCRRAAEHDADVRLVLGGLEDLLNGRSNHFVHEYSLECGGVMMRCLMTAVPLVQTGGAVISHVDITEQFRAKRQVEVSELHFRSIFDRSPVGITEMSLDGRFLRVNRRFSEMLGYPADQMVGWDFRRITHPEDLPEQETLIEHLLGGGPNSYTMEKRYLRADGVAIWVHLTATRVRDADPEKPDYLVTIAEDITERREAEDALRRSEERLRFALGAAEAGAWDMDIAEGFESATAWSERMWELYGLEPGSVTPNYQSWLTCVHPDDRQRMEQTAYLNITQSNFSHEFRIIHPRRGLRWLMSFGRTTFDAQGSPIRMAGIDIDITDRKRMEEDLRASEERFRFATEAAHAGTWELDLQTRRTIRSESCYRLLGLPRSPDPQFADWFAHIHPDDREMVAKQFDESLSTGEFSAEYRINHPATGLRWIADFGRILHDHQKRPQRMFGIVLDVTERRMAEEQLKSVNDVLERRVAERTADAEHKAQQLRALAMELSETEHRERRRLAQLIHDHLQQLLVAARLRLSMARSRAAEEQTLTAIQQADDLVGESIQMSRSLTVQLSPPVLQEGTIGTVLEWLARRMQEEQGLFVEVLVDPGTPPTTEDLRAFLYDAARELLFNVVKHAGVRRAVARVGPGGENLIELAIEDAGQGFQPHRKKNHADSEHFGLFSVQQRVQQMGGSIQIQSEPGRGTRITLLVPSAPPPPPIAPAIETPVGESRAPAPRPAAPAAGASAELRIRVLLADDHRILREGLASLLQQQPDIELVGQATDGRLAVDLAHQTHPDVVIMDVSMPGMNGIEATRRLKTELPDVRVIGLSMHDEDDMAQAMREAGAATYLTKGGPYDDLMGAIRQT